MVDNMTETLMISNEEKNQLVKNERFLEVMLAIKKIHWQIKRQHCPKKRFNIYLFKLGSYPCMNMCINVP